MTEHEHTEPYCVILRRGGEREEFCRECDPVRMAAVDNWTLPELEERDAVVVYSPEAVDATLAASVECDCGTLLELLTVPGVAAILRHGAEILGPLPITLGMAAALVEAEAEWLARVHG